MQSLYKKANTGAFIGNGPWDVDSQNFAADAVEEALEDGWFATPWEACGTDENGVALDDDGSDDGASDDASTKRGRGRPPKTE